LDDSFSSKQDEFRGVDDTIAAASEGGAAAASVVVDKSPSDGGVVTNQEAEALVAQALLSMANEAFVSRASDANPKESPSDIGGELLERVAVAVNPSSEAAKVSVGK